MANQTYYVSGADGLGVDTLTPNSQSGNPGLRPGKKLLAFGQSTNVPATQTAQTSAVAADSGGGGLSCVALPALGASGRGSVTVANNLITANSFVRVWVQNQNADATAGLFVVAWEGSNASRVAGTSFVIEYYASAAMAQAWVAGYEIIN